MRPPPAVLVARELHPAPFGLLDEFAAGSQVLDEGLLRKDMLAGGERASHQIDAKLGCVVMSGTSIRGSRSCPSKSSVASAWGKNASRSPVARARSRTDGQDIEPIPLIGLEVRAADPARAEQRDARS